MNNVGNIQKQRKINQLLGTINFYEYICNVQSNNVRGKIMNFLNKISKKSKNICNIQCKGK